MLEFRVSPGFKSSRIKQVDGNPAHQFTPSFKVESERRIHASEIQWQKERRGLKLEIEKLQGELAIPSTSKAPSLFRNILSRRK